MTTPTLCADTGADIDALLCAYRAGVFPMAENRHSPASYWVDPDMRGILPLDAFHLPRRLKRTLMTAPFAIRINSNFSAVMRACAAATPDRPDTWINQPLFNLYTRLQRLGYAHSVECWQEDRLAGGLYGVHLGAVFFGESMFSQARDASKIALVHLVARLRAGGFQLLDIQFVTDHLRQFGAVEIPRAAFHHRLRDALQSRGDFYSLSGDDPLSVLQSISQTS